MRAETVGKGKWEMKKVYVCDDNITSIYSAIYDAWKESRDAEAGIELRGQINQQLFCEYVEVTAEERKSVVVERLIQKNLGYNAYWDIYHALLSADAQKADAVFRVMQEARFLKDSKKIMEHLTNEAVAKVFQLSRKVGNEAHLFIEFIRFRELYSGVLFSEITPESRVLTCIGDHFADRFPLENWMIYDKTHKEFLVHRERTQWVIVAGEELNREMAGKVSDAEKEYQRLWKGFFHSIAIKERTNPICQRSHLPIHFRKDMTEFESENYSADAFVQRGESSIQTEKHCIHAKSIV